MKCNHPKKIGEYEFVGGEGYFDFPARGDGRIKTTTPFFRYNDEIEYSWDSDRDRIITNREDLYIQMVHQYDPGEKTTSSWGYLLRMGDTLIGFTGINGSPLRVSKLTDKDGNRINLIEDIGAPIVYDYDAFLFGVTPEFYELNPKFRFRNPNRPHAKQILTNSSCFKTYEEMRFALDFVATCMSHAGRFGSKFTFYSPEIKYRSEPVVYAADLVSRIESGDLVNV